MKKPTGLKWGAEIWVDQVWIDDGFELTAENLEEAITATLLGYAHDREIDVRVFPPKRAGKPRKMN